MLYYKCQGFKKPEDFTKKLITHVDTFNLLQWWQLHPQAIRTLFHTTTKTINFLGQYFYVCNNMSG